MHERIGDSAIIGSRVYAENKSGAACATGNGECIMRLRLCKYACDQIQSKNSNNRIITVDPKGRFGIACNTISMSTAMITNKNQKPIIAFGCD
jgi:L-asparaginase / beta-aspartyl-peptidase